MPGVKWLIINAQLCICNAKVATGAATALPKHLMRRMRNILQCKLAKYRQLQSSLKDVYKFDCFIHQNIKTCHFIHLALLAWQLQLSMIIQELSSFLYEFNLIRNSFFTSQLHFPHFIIDYRFLFHCFPLPA